MPTQAYYYLHYCRYRSGIFRAPQAGRCRFRVMDDQTVPPSFEMPSGDPTHDLRNAPTKAHYLSSVQWMAYGVVLFAGVGLAARHLRPNIGDYMELILWIVSAIGVAVAILFGIFAYFARKEEREKMQSAYARMLDGINVEREQIIQALAEARTKNAQLLYEDSTLGNASVSIVPSVHVEGSVHVKIRVLMRNMSGCDIVLQGLLIEHFTVENITDDAKNPMVGTVPTLHGIALKSDEIRLPATHGAPEVLERVFVKPEGVMLKNVTNMRIAGAVTRNRVKWERLNYAFQDIPVQ